MTLHEVVIESTHVPCVCGALPEQPCICQDGVHLARVARARRAQFISRADFAAAIHDADVFTGLTVLIDPGAHAAGLAEVTHG